jgi:branched-chain amino acid transport system substrate-binding protein
MTIRPAHRRRSALLLFVAATMVAAACGSSGTSSSPSTTSKTSTGPAGDVLGTPKAASGEPVVIGYSYDGATDAADNSDELIGAKAAVEYVNQYMGGIGGHPIKLDICSTNLDPAKATACVTQFVTNDVAAVIAANGGQAAIEFPPIAKQNIPVMLSSSLIEPLLNDPNVFVINSGRVLSFAGPAKLAADAGAKHATLFVIDLPAAAEPLKKGAPGYYKAAGVDLDVVLVPIDTADFSPQVQAAMTKDPGQFYLVGTSQFCSRAINAIEAAGFKGQILGLHFCFDANSKKTVTRLKGIKEISANSYDHEDAEYKLYAAIMAKFASKEVLIDGGAPASSGYSIVMALARAASGLKGAATRDSIRAAIKSMPAQKKPLGGGLMFQCNQPDPTQTSVCSTGGVVATLDADGNPTNHEVVDAAQLLKRD